MKAKELDEHMRTVGTWVDWQHTRDQFLAGDKGSDVTGIAVAWMPTFSTLHKALQARCNLFGTHDALYSAVVDTGGNIIGGASLREMDLNATIGEDDAWVRKRKWLEDKEMVVYRCHDVWDDFPDVGIHGAWADWLGFNGSPIARRKYYEVYEVGNIALKELAEKILERVKLLGQDSIGVIGELERKVSRIALGTGAITEYREMHSMGADVLLLTDDGTRLWESGQWSLDSDISLLIVNHSTAEEPGMRALATYIQKKFPKVPVIEIPVGCIYKTVK